MRRELPSSSSSIFTDDKIEDLKVHFEIVPQVGDGRWFPRSVVVTPGRVRAVLEFLRRRGRNDFVEVLGG